MAWERRKGSRRRYYYHTVLQDGVVVKQYLGAACDAATRIVAKADEITKSQKQAARLVAQTERELCKSIAEDFKSLEHQFRTLLRADLMSRGFFHRYGAWKKMKPRNRTSAPSDAAESLPPTERLAYLVERANRGDPDALDDIRRALADHPFITETVGDLSAHVERTLIGAIAGTQVFLAESLKLQAEDFRTQLGGGQHVTAMEKMLIDHVILAWLELNHARMMSIDSSAQRGETRFRQDLVDVASRRLATAMAELVKVRKLLGNDVVATEPDTTSTDES
jgi:hypothetical protein